MNICIYIYIVGLSPVALTQTSPRRLSNRNYFDCVTRIPIQLYRSVWHQTVTGRRSSFDPVIQPLEKKVFI